MPNLANLSGTVTDDGKPLSPGVTTCTWSLVSGPAAVTFGNPNAVNTTAEFTMAGTYVLRLTASDGEFQSSSEVTITVQAPTTTGGTTSGTSGISKMKAIRRR
jgi:hypothetical protein